uniref:KilA-N domain-containing protein n=1 Tax=viral metagenome TaxID=1070528 RepID=A0A6C0I764_9ZZZZ
MEKFEIKCDMCFTIVKRKTDLAKHKKSETCKKINNIIKILKEEKQDEVNKLQDKINKQKNEYDLKLNLLEEKNNILLKENNEQNKKILTLEIKLKEVSEKSNEYRIIVEKSTINKFNFKNKENDNFQIDININNKQLNRTKYKDVPEDVIKKDIQSLKLKDNYQLEHRETDGYINITNLCKAGGKKFNHWNSIDKTKRFLDVLSSTAGIPVVTLIKQEHGKNGERHTWSHPQVAINIAQWISPEFDVLVSKWVYEIMLTGKVDIKDNKTTQELDQINKENKLLKNRIKLLESKVLQKQPRETFEDGKNVIYIITTEYKEAQGHYKIGKAKDLKERMSVYNTSDKHEVIYYTSCKTKKKMDLLEQIIQDRLESKRIEPNKEWFLSEDDAEDFIKIVEECKKVIDF